MENNITASNLCVRDGPGYEKCPGEHGRRVGAQPCCAQGPPSSILITLLLPLSTAQRRPAKVMSYEEKGKNERAVQPPNPSFETSVGKVGGGLFLCF